MESARLPVNRRAEDRAAVAQSVSDAALRDAMLIKIAWLRSFIAVAERGGFGAATNRLHLSQSRVSAHIAALEGVLGFPLFERKARPTALTPAGEIFREHAETALQELQEGVEAARSISRPGYGHLVVGSYPSVSSAFLPNVLSGLVLDYPEISVELVEGTAAKLEAALASGAVDLAFRPLQPPVRDPSFRTQALWREAIVAVMREDDPLAATPRLGIHDLKGRALIGNPAGPENQGGGFDLRHAAGDEAEGLVIAYLTDQPATLVALVRAAFGIGVISQLALSTTSTEGLAVKRIDSPTAFRDVAVFWNERSEAKSSFDAFMKAVACTPPPAGVGRIVEA